MCARSAGMKHSYICKPSQQDRSGSADRTEGGGRLLRGPRFLRKTVPGLSPCFHEPVVSRRAPTVSLRPVIRNDSLTGDVTWIVKVKVTQSVNTEKVVSKEVTIAPSTLASRMTRLYESGMGSDVKLRVKVCRVCGQDRLFQAGGTGGGRGEGSGCPWACSRSGEHGPPCCAVSGRL